MGSTPQLPLFQQDADFDFMEGINREFYDQYTVEVSVFLYDQNQGDPLYGDDIDKSFALATSEPSYRVPMVFPELPEWRAQLTKHGQDEKRPLKGFVWSGVFEALGVSRGPEDGDHILMEAERYKVTDFDPTDYFGNTQRFLTYGVTLERVRLESIEQSPRLVDADGLYPATEFRPDPRKVPPQTEAPAPHRGPPRNPFEE